VLSDSAFKVFVYISLHAERNSGRLRIDVSALARSVAKTEGEVRGRMDELVQAGVCRFNAGFIEIQDPYWPYHRTPVRSAVADSEAFFASVRRLFLSYACVSGTFSPADERLASEWCCRGISFERVERAVHLGVARISRVGTAQRLTIESADALDLPAVVERTRPDRPSVGAIREFPDRYRPAIASPHAVAGAWGRHRHRMSLSRFPSKSPTLWICQLPSSAPGQVVHP
jgi:hypothetical protein